MTARRNHPAIPAIGALLLAIAAPTLAAPVAIEKGDRIAIVGNGFADRMQHSGHLEALIHLARPEAELVFRNLGFSGDELETRLRSEGFGTPEEWLKHVGADVVWAFFGYNESFAGPAGLDSFRASLKKFVADTVGADYGGGGATRLVLFAPSAAEDVGDPNYPAAAAANERIAPYAKAVEEVARETGVPFVDLFAISRAAFEAAPEPLTFNTIHFTDAGYAALAPAMFEAIAGEPAPAVSGAEAGPLAGRFEKLRGAVNEKNALWFSRYRTVDGYNVYGGRSFLEFDGVKNRDTMQREMEIRDAMTANRDRAVWAAARGEEPVFEDVGLPAPIEVETNKPGPLPDGGHEFLSGEEGIAKMAVPPGLKVNLFASEEDFPRLANPVQMNFDTKGRLWVAAWPNYPGRTPDSTVGDSLLIFEDRDADGRADECKVFLDDLNAPTGFQFYKDGVVVIQAPDVWFVRDADGDDRADTMERILGGLDSADSHHTANAICLDPGGAMYLSDGVFHRTQSENPWTAPVRNIDAAIYRFEPNTGKFERYISYGFANPHGRVFDRWGNDLVTDATGNNTYFGPAFSGFIDYPHKHAGLKEFWPRPMRPCPGTGILSSRHFPEEYREAFLNLNVIGFQGIYRVKMREEGSGLWGDTVEPHFLQSSDPNCRPIAIDVAPDGSVYFLDWHNPIIGHMQHHLRDPNRDHKHGRVYRVVAEDRPLLEPKKVAGEPIEALLELLTEPENNVRTRAKIELGARDSKAVVAATKAWAKRFDPKKIEDAHPLLEALWVHQWHNVVDAELLALLLDSPEPRARAQAVRVAGYWRDRLADPLAIARDAANDPNPRVRLEGVRVASFFRGREAMDVAHDILKYETDYYLDYTFGETVRQLRTTIEGGYFPEDPAVVAALVPRLNDTELLAAPDSAATFRERADRPGPPMQIRVQSLAALAEANGTALHREALDALRRVDASPRAASAALDHGYILASVAADRLAEIRADLEALASNAKRVEVRRAAWAALVAADGDPTKLWNATSGAARRELIESIGLHPDAQFRLPFRPLLEAQIADEAAPEDIRREAVLALPLMGPDVAPEIFAQLAERIRAGKDVPTTARALMQVSREDWNAELAEPVCDALLAWAKGVPESERNEDACLTVVQATRELSALLPDAAALRIRSELRRLSVPVFLVRSVREKMLYDTTRIVVEADKPFEIVFENVDTMPHNVVVVRPGSREAIGMKADKMDPTPDDKGRAYIPRDGRILDATPLVEPGSRARLKMKAPKETGTYEYFCTYPEHWKVMFGELVVLESLDEELSPAAAKAAGVAKKLFGE